MKEKNNEKIKIILLGVIATILLCLLIVISLKYKEDSKYKNEINNSDKNSATVENISEEVTNNSNEDTTDKGKDTPTSSNKDDNLSEKDKTNTSGNTDSNENTTPNNNSTSNSQNNQQSSYQESDVISYFEELDQNIVTYQNSNDTLVKDKIKNGFITVVDFLFYGSTIKGYTFSELTNEAKIKVLTLALKIDNKIDKYFPNYKESIKSKMTDFKERAALLYLETTSKLCESAGEDSCNLARENFNDMKESFGFTWDNIKKIASSSASTLSTILKEWYQSIKD